MYSIEQSDIQLLDTAAAIRYHCYFPLASQHLVNITMEIDTENSTEVFVLPSWTPGSYKIREFVSHLGNLSVCDANGQKLSAEWTTKNILTVTGNTTSTIRLEYTYYANERTVRTMHINRWRAYIMPVNCMMYVRGRMNEIHHVYLHHDQSLWKSVSTALSPVSHETTLEKPVIVGALNYDILADSPLEIGNHQTASFTALGAQHDVALISPIPLNIDWLAEQCKTIVETEGQLFGGTLPYDRYVFMVQVGSNIYGGLEHSRCSVNMIDISTMTDTSRSGRLLALLCHEFFHTWNIKRIRPIEYGPFDYINECYSPMLWLVEGFTSYYDDLLSYRCGFMSKLEYISSLGSEHLAKLERVPGRYAMSTRESSYLAWVKLYAQSPDGANRFPSYYLKGGIITLMLELYIIANSNGTKRLDDVMRALWQRYCNNPEQGVTEEEVFHIITQSTGLEVRDVLLHLLNGTDDIPYQTFFTPFGLIWESSGQFDEIEDSSAVFTGLQAKDLQGNVIITHVESGSPAEVASIGIDDEILSVNNIRVTSVAHFSELLSLAGSNTTVTILGVCDSAVYTTNLTLIARPTYSLRVGNNLSAEQKSLLDFWLER